MTIMFSSPFTSSHRTVLVTIVKILIQIHHFACTSNQKAKGVVISKGRYIAAKENLGSEDNYMRTVGSVLNPQRTLCTTLFIIIITESLLVFCAVVFYCCMYKHTNKMN